MALLRFDEPDKRVENEKILALKSFYKALCLIPKTPGRTGKELRRKAAFRNERKFGLSIDAGKLLEIFAKTI